MTKLMWLQQLHNLRSWPNLVVKWEFKRLRLSKLQKPTNRTYDAFPFKVCDRRSAILREVLQRTAWRTRCRHVHMDPQPCLTKFSNSLPNFTKQLIGLHILHNSNVAMSTTQRFNTQARLRFTTNFNKRNATNLQLFNQKQLFFIQAQDRINRREVTMAKTKCKPMTFKQLGPQALREDIRYVGHSRMMLQHHMTFTHLGPQPHQANLNVSRTTRQVHSLHKLQCRRAVRLNLDQRFIKLTNISNTLQDTVNNSTHGCGILRGLLETIQFSLTRAKSHGLLLLRHWPYQGSLEEDSLSRHTFTVVKPVRCMRCIREHLKKGWPDISIRTQLINQQLTCGRQLQDNITITKQEPQHSFQSCFCPLSWPRLLAANQRQPCLNIGPRLG